MTKLYTAITKEIDVPEQAVQDLLGQLNLKDNMLTNTVGIIHYYFEYIETGVYDALCNALPFPLVGCVSDYLASNNGYGDTCLTITMLTSDDAHFQIFTVNDTNKKETNEIIQELKSLCTEMSLYEKPKMAFTFLAPLNHFSGDNLIEAVNDIKDPFPLFGTIAFYLGELDLSCQIAVNKSYSSDTIIFLAVYGNVEPQFYVTTSFAFEESFSQDAEITDASDATLKTINGISAVQYLKQQNIITDDNTVIGTTIWAVPAILSYPNGISVVRAFVTVIDGTEHILATGTMKIGAKIKFSILDSDKTIASAEQLMNNLSDLQKKDIIAYSCGARAWSLGINHSAEAKTIQLVAEKHLEKSGNMLRYSIAYSGGEICPIYNDQKQLINVLHNYTLIACTFD